MIFEPTNDAEYFNDNLRIPVACMLRELSGDERFVLVHICWNHITMDCIEAKRTVKGGYIKNV